MTLDKLSLVIGAILGTVIVIAYEAIWAIFVIRKTKEESE